MDNAGYQFENLNIYGLTYSFDDIPVPTNDEIKNNLNPDLINIINYHVPYRWDEFSSLGFDIQLSGHTHGGQFYPVVNIANIMFKYNMGLFKNESGKYIISLPQIIKKDEQITPEMINNFLEYAAKFYSNFGNYTIKKKKFFPEFNKSESESQAIFENILKTSTRYTEFSSIWQIIKCIIFDKSENVINIDLEEKEGKNCYYLGGIKKEQIQSTDGFLLSKDISKYTFILL